MPTLQENMDNLQKLLSQPQNSGISDKSKQGITTNYNQYTSGNTAPTQQQPIQQMQPQVQDNSALIRQMYEQQQQATLAQLRQAIASSKSKYESQITQAPDQYNKMRDNVSTNYYKGLPALREALANQGSLDGGQGRQAQLTAATSMQNDMNSLNTQQQDYINQLKMAISDVERSGSLQEAQSMSEIAAQLSQALIGESNRVESNSYNRLQDTLANNFKATEAGYNRSQDIASSMGYANPYAQYAITPDIQQQLAPYAGDYAAFIQNNPNSPLVPYAQNARFQKMLGMSGDQYRTDLEQYRSPDYQSNQLRDALTQSQIRSSNALATQRSTPSAPAETNYKNTYINTIYRKLIEGQVLTAEEKAAIGMKGEATSEPSKGEAYDSAYRTFESKIANGTAKQWLQTYRASLIDALGVSEYNKMVERAEFE